MESIILQTPLLLCLFGAALFFCLYGRAVKWAGFVFSALSVLICIGAAAYAVVLGANYEELGIVFLIFLALNLSVYKGNTGGEK